MVRAEHVAYGIPFPPLGERFERLEEQLAIVTGLWGTPDGERFTHRGRHYTLVDSPALPKPVQRPGPPVIVGGLGRARTPRLAATYAQEFNVPFAALDAVAKQYQRVQAACEQAGRDPASLRFSFALTVCCGSTDAEIERRARAIGQDVGQLREYGLAGTPDEVAERIAAFAAAGASRAYLQVLDLRSGPAGAHRRRGGAPGASGRSWGPGRRAGLRPRSP